METSTEWQQLHLRVHMFTACAVINLQVLPEKLNPLVRPLMEAIKREENTLVQGYAASFIAKLLQQCAGRSPCPNPKIIKNLCASACVDSAATPSSACPVPPTQENTKGYTSQCLCFSIICRILKSPLLIMYQHRISACLHSIDPISLSLFLMPLGVGLEKDGMHHTVNKTRGIITLYRHQRAAFAITSKRGPTPKAPKTPTTELPPGSTISTDNDEVLKHIFTFRSYRQHFAFPLLYMICSFFRARSHFLFRDEGQSSP